MAIGGNFNGEYSLVLDAEVGVRNTYRQNQAVSVGLRLRANLPIV